MEVIYCSSCEKRIPQEEFDLGRAVRSGADSYCAACVKAGSAPTGREAGQRTGPPSSRRMRRERPGSRISAPDGAPSRSKGVAVLAGVLAVLGVGVYLGFVRKRGGPPAARDGGREPDALPAPTVIVTETAPAREGPRADIVPGAPEGPHPVEEQEYVPTPAPAPEASSPAPARGESPPDPPAPFAAEEGEKMLYSWDWRRWLPGMQGKRMIVRLGLNLLHTDYNCGTAWTPKGNFVVPERGIIRTRFLVTERMDVHLLVGVEGHGNQRHTWTRVEPGKWFAGVVAMDDMRAWGPAAERVSLPAGLKAHQVVLHIDETLPGVSRLYVSEILVVAVE